MGWGVCVCVYVCVSVARAWCCPLSYLSLGQLIWTYRINYFEMLDNSQVISNYVCGISS